MSGWTAYQRRAGASTDWSKGVYMDVDSHDAKDTWMATNYLKALSWVDSDRIGVWGPELRGYFTFIAMTDQPTLFA